jgi:hypothetical protein
MPENGIYRFGVFELDSRARELKKHGVRIKLQDQPLRILLLLVQHTGEVVTREQIQSELWPAGTYVDYENYVRLWVTPHRIRGLSRRYRGGVTACSFRCPAMEWKIGRRRSHRLRFAAFGGPSWRPRVCSLSLPSRPYC